MRLVGPTLAALVLLSLAACSGSAEPSAEVVASEGSQSTLTPNEEKPASTAVAGELAAGGEALALTADSWQTLPQMLTARSNALGVWTGTEVLIVGGDPEPWCPPNADCVPPEFDQLTDGAAFNPSTNQWRTIADSPVPIGHWSSTAMAGGHLYTQVHPTFTATGRTIPAFLRYDIADDEWAVLPSPSDTDDWYQLVAANDSVIAYTGSDEQGERPDRLFDPETRTWSDLPADPLSPSFDRFVVVEGDEVFLFGKDIVPNPGSEGPSLARIARLDLGTGVWEVLGESEVLETYGGVLLDRHVVFPWSGEADGGQVNNWGRSYPSGGIWNLDSQVWSDLPEPARTSSFEVAGVVGSDQAAFHSAVGSVLDFDDNIWVTLPPLPDDDLELTGRTIVSMGRSLFVFGGEYWTDGSGTQTAAAYAISPSR